MYIDGAQDGSDTHTGGYSNTADAWYFARKSTTYFDGMMDDVRIYNTGLSATKVASIYNNSRYHQINSSQENKVTDGLVGFWTFDGKDVDGTTIKDVSGNGNHGTAANAPFPTIGKVGQGYDFDGSIDYVATPSLTVTGDKSISAWIKLDTVSRRNIIFGKVFQYAFFVESTNKLSSYAGGGITSGATSLTTDTWYHVVVTITDGGASNTDRLYINGVQRIVTGKLSRK